MGKYIKIAVASNGLLKTANKTFDGAVKMYQAGLNLYNKVKAAYDDDSKNDQILNSAKNIQALTNDVLRQAQNTGLSAKKARWYSDTIANKASALYDYSKKNNDFENPYGLNIYQEALTAANAVYRASIEWDYSQDISAPQKEYSPSPFREEMPSSDFGSALEENEAPIYDMEGLQTTTSSDRKKNMMKRVQAWKKFY